MSGPKPFDFDAWMQLYKDNPEGYLEHAKEYVHGYIDRMFPEDDERRQRMKAMYWRAVNDPEIRKIKDPYVRAQRASTMMNVQARKLFKMIGGST